MLQRMGDEYSGQRPVFVIYNTGIKSENSYEKHKSDKSAGLFF